MIRYDALWRVSPEALAEVDHAKVEQRGTSEIFRTPKFEIDCYDATGALLFTAYGYPSREYAVKHCGHYGVRVAQEQINA